MSIGRGLVRPFQAHAVASNLYRRTTAVSGSLPFSRSSFCRRDLCRRQFGTRPEETMAERNQRVALYMVSVALATLGVSYASVPLYKVFCQATGFGGTTQRVLAEDVPKDLTPAVDGRVLKITFSADVNDELPWKFKPQQNSVKVVPGETALAFYKAVNPTKKAITGVATYNVFPPKAGLYFNKIQCFCFEEQRLRPGDDIDMPVFFFIDKDILSDPAMDHVNNITLSYTFFKTGEDEGTGEADS
mmetsp:Transcript_6604/g.15152  ORF Transcript_6604/g.15152 Transcript_6604/m.15152 type:complete len:245 (-) Transcript_6604:80-814(-)